MHVDTAHQQLRSLRGACLRRCCEFCTNLFTMNPHSPCACTCRLLLAAVVHVDAAHLLSNLSTAVPECAVMERRVSNRGHVGEGDD